MTPYDEHIERLRAVVHEPPAGLRPFADQVRDEPQSVTGEDVAALLQAGYSEDDVFAAGVSASVAAGLERLDAALAALR